MKDVREDFCICNPSQTLVQCLVSTGESGASMDRNQSIVPVGRLEGEEGGTVGQFRP